MPERSPASSVSRAEPSRSRRAALGELAGLGLARRSGELWAVGHALVRTYAGQKVVPPQDALERLANGFALMAYTANQTGYPADFRGLPVHVFALAERAEAAGLQASGVLWNELGRHASQIGDYPSAYEFYWRALQNDEAAFGPEHPTVAVRLNNLGLALRNLGELGKAKAAFERALQIDEAAQGPDHPDRGQTLPGWQGAGIARRKPDRLCATGRDSYRDRPANRQCWGYGWG